MSFSQLLTDACFPPQATDFLLLGGFFEDPELRRFTLLLGLIGFSGGVYLMWRTYNAYQDASSAESNDKVLRFEFRKYRRRMVANAMITAIGVMLSALYWVHAPRTFAILISMVLVSLLGVLGLAFLDLLSVGLQQIATPDDTARKAMIAEYLKRREQKHAEQEGGGAE